MQNSTTKKLDTASRRREIWRIGIKHPVKFIVSVALLLAAGSAVAGVIFVPVGGNYLNPELAPVQVQDNGSGSAVIRSSGLAGEFSLDASDLPAEFEPPPSGCQRLPFEQDLELVVNPSLGVVEGRTRGRIATPGGTLDYRADVAGSATCLPAGGLDCGQLIVDLEMRGVLTDASEPARVGLLRMQTLGSLVRVPGSARWASLTANARLGGDAGLIASLHSMEEGESCGL